MTSGRCSLPAFENNILAKFQSGVCSQPCFVFRCSDAVAKWGLKIRTLALSISGADHSSVSCYTERKQSEGYEWFALHTIPLYSSVETAEMLHSVDSLAADDSLRFQIPGVKESIELQTWSFAEGAAVLTSCLLLLRKAPVFTRSFGSFKISCDWPSI